MVNIELANKALSSIEKFPEYHNQGDWCGGWGGKFKAAVDNGEHPEICGTTLCVAGWVSFLDAPKGTVFEAGNSWFELPNGEDVNMENYARRQLGLSRAQAHAMFITARSLADLRAVVAQLDTDPESEFDALNEAIEASRYAEAEAEAQEAETA